MRAPGAPDFPDLRCPALGCGDSFSDNRQRAAWRAGTFPLIAAAIQLDQAAASPVVALHHSSVVVGAEEEADGHPSLHFGYVDRAEPDELAARRAARRNRDDSNFTDLYKGAS